MTAMGWIFITLSWGVIIALCALCYAKILKEDDND